MFAIKEFVAYVIPDLPTHILVKMQREQFLTRQSNQAADRHDDVVRETMLRRRSAHRDVNEPMMEGKDVNDTRWSAIICLGIMTLQPYFSLTDVWP